MAKYLFMGSYTLEGARGLIKEGGTSRRDHFHENTSNLGGRVEAFYFAFGEHDFYSIVDLPDNISAGALAMGLSSSGFVKMSTVVLITPEEADVVMQKIPSIRYRPPGQPA